MGATPFILTQARSAITPSRLRGCKRILIALDYTGTVCEIGSDRCPPEIAQVLNRLSLSPQVTLALVTGCCGSELARITRDSLDRLALRPGMPVWALLKAVTFDHRVTPPRENAP